MRPKVPDHVQEKIEKIFPKEKSLTIARAPGRINLIGEHTDYNKGLVLPASIDSYLYFAIRPIEGDQIILHALDREETKSIPCDGLQVSGIAWLDYIQGLLVEFQKLGVTLRAFECCITSEVPIGAGVSSSAALDCAALLALNTFFETELDAWDLVHMSNRSNNNFLGIKSGILDQFASIFGTENHLLFMDCASLVYKKIPIAESEFTWLLINTNVNHSHLSSAYNDRVNECQSALASIQKMHPNIEHLSEVQSVNQISNIQFENLNCKNRAEYIIEENARVREFIQALKQEDFTKCGKLLYQCHQGLSKKYEVSCNELDFLVDVFKEDTSVLGSRMMGGGFGGCTLNLVHKDAMSRVQEKAQEAYKMEFGIDAACIPVRIGQGAQLMI